MHAASRILTGALLLAGTAAFAQASATASAVPATARIYAPITITVTAYHGGTGLSFGDIIPGVAAGTLRLDPVADARTATGVTTAATSSMAVHAAQFTVGGQANAAYAITLPTTAVTLTSGGNNMTATLFTASVNGGATTAATASPAGNTGGGASQAFTVGATLNVGANQVGGDYTGSFNVTVTYN
jgi:hypothetical protein